MKIGRSGVLLLLCGLVCCASPPPPTITLGAPQAAPRGYIAFCTRDPQFCDGRGPARVALTGARWAALLTVNDTVNAQLKPQTDQAPVGMADDWEIPTGSAAADCEDFVLAKKLGLLAQGWPGPALRIGVVEPMPGQRHAVLVADTDEGLFVLDNLERKVLRADKTDYRWVAIQVSTNPDHWERATKVAGFSDDRP